MQPSTDERKPKVTCAVCGSAATVTADPPRRTFARGPDPEDPSFALIAVLPELDLCDDHFRETREAGLLIGWCDDARCRRYGKVGERSPCGEAYERLRR